MCLSCALHRLKKEPCPSLVLVLSVHLPRKRKGHLSPFQSGQGQRGQKRNETLNIEASHILTDYTTSSTRGRLTSEIGRDRVYLTGYDRA